MRIRPATPEDARAIAHVHMASWRSTYRGVLPDAVLANLSLDQREVTWRQQTETARQDPLGVFVLVAEDETASLVGFASAGPEREATSGFDGGLYAVYLLEKHQRQGIGRRFVAEAIGRFRERGYESMRVWVLDGNPAQAFYERLGGQRVGEVGREIGGEVFVEVAYGWRDLDDYG